MSSFERYSDYSERGRDVPSFIEARPPVVTGPGQRPRPHHAINLMDHYESDSVLEDDVVQVYLRMKPTDPPSTLYEIRSDTLLLTTGEAALSDYSRRTQCNVSKRHTFSHIFNENATQKQIFDHVVKDNLKKLMEGHSYTLLTYGASGSGKTYTLMGTEDAPGLIPRSLEYLFKLVSPAQHPHHRPRDGIYETLTPAQAAQEMQLVSQLRKGAQPARSARRAYRRMSQRLSNDFHSLNTLGERTTHYVWVSFVEIYNEAVYDLLVRPDHSRGAARPALKICEDSNGTAYVKGAKQAFVRTGTEAYDVMATGQQNLRVAATGVHARSSRSHCIFTITLLSETAAGVVSTFVRLCDLAGSERADRTHNSGVRMLESRAINSSLHVLERCLGMLRRKQRAQTNMDATAINMRVPFRESKLTRLLGAPLSGVSHEAVSMVVTVNPSPLYAQETRHVLQLAAVASDISINPIPTDSGGSLEMSYSSLDRDVELMKLRADNERLQFEMNRLYSQRETEEHEVRLQSATTMQELLKESKDATLKYYTQQMALIETRHAKQMALLQTSHSRELQRYKEEMNELIKENTKLKAELTQRPLEIAVVESELEHLHTCLAERDQADTEENTEVMEGSGRSVVVSDDSDSYSDSDSDSDNTLETITEEDSVLGSARSTIDNVGEADGRVTIDVRGGGDAGNSRDTTICSVEDADSESGGETEIIFGSDSSAGLKTDISGIRAFSIDSRKHDSTQNLETAMSNLSDTGVEFSNECNTSGKDISQKANSVNNIDLTSCSQSIDSENNQCNEYINMINDDKQNGTKHYTDVIMNDLVHIVHNHSEISSSDHGFVVNNLLDITAENDLQKRSANNDTYNTNSTNTEQRKSNVVLDTSMCAVPITYTKHEYIVCSKDDYINRSIDTDCAENNANSEKPETNQKNSLSNPVDILLTEHKLTNSDDVKTTSTNNSDCMEITDKCLDDTNSGKIHSKEKHCETENKPDTSLTITDNDNELGILSMCRPKSECTVFTSKKDSIDFERRKTFEEPKHRDSNNLNDYNIGECEKSIPEDTTLPYNANIPVMLSLTNQTQSVDLNKDATESLRVDGAPIVNTLKSETKERHIYNTGNETHEIYIQPEPRFSLSKDFSAIIGNFDFHSKPKQTTSADECSKLEQNKTSKVNRSLKLRKKHVNDMSDKEDKVEGKQATRLKKGNKLRDIANLQQEYSDVTLGVSSVKKEVPDIASPEKFSGDENVPASVKTCPAKSTRSRRHLYTPCAEPLDQSVASDDDSNMRVRVPRPSYHRGTRARRKL